MWIGALWIDFPVVQAALSGYSDWPTRVIARRLGAGYTVGEVMLDRFVLDVSKGRKARRHVRITDEERPCGAQLMGSDPNTLASAAIKLVAAGFDCIDLNFGCPVKKVVRKCRGGYLLSRPELALQIVACVRDAVPVEIPVTVKMRRGMDASSESRDNFYAIFDGVFERGVAAVTVHGRTVQQRYDGPSSWDFLAEVKRHAGARVVLGSGDLFTAQACLAMMRETGVDGVTAARGAIGNPWIFRQARELSTGHPMPEPPRVPEQGKVIAEHFRLAERVYGSERACSTMRKFGIKYSRLHPDARAVREAFLTVRRSDQWYAVLERWYTEDRAGRHVSMDVDGDQ